MRYTITLLWFLLAVGAIAAWGCPPAISEEFREAYPAQPRIPSRVFHLVEYGAKGDGITLNTDAFRRAIDACSAAGGGTLRVPAGRFLTDRFSLASCVRLNLARGAVILFPPDCDVSSEGAGHGRGYLISATACHDVAITGSGVIDGQGSGAWERVRAAKRAAPGGSFEDSRPRLVGFDHCQRVLVDGVTLTNSPMFHLVPHQCTDVTISGITILSPSNSPNTDGIDPSVCHTVRITGCRIDVGDDCIAVKAGKDDPVHPSGPSSDITIVGCTFLHGHGMSVGSETVGGLRRMIVRDCTFADTGAGIRLKSARDRGGLVEDLIYSDLRMTRVHEPIQIASYYPKIPKAKAADSPEPVGPLTPIWRNITIRNVIADSTASAGMIIGAPEMPVSGVTLQNVHISSRTGLRLRNVHGLRLINTRITTESGPPLLEEGGVDAFDGDAQ